MELQALLVLGGIGVAGIAVLLLMGLFSASGTSYEEAIAQQRKATTELLALAENKAKAKKSVKKKDKKLAKKEKKENSVTTGSEVESEAHAESSVEDDPAPPTKGHVEFSAPTVVDVPRDTPPNVKIRKRGKDPKVKPILLNKEDPSCVSDPSMVPIAAETTVANHFEEMHPKDEIELMQSALSTEKVAEKVEEPVEKKEVKPAKPQKAAKVTPKPLASTEVKDEAKEKIVSDIPKDQRKGKKEKKLQEEVVEVSTEEVVPPLNIPQPTELTTEKLLKQVLAAPAPAPAPSPPAHKGKKKKQEPNALSLIVGDHGGVNVGELVRVVREASLSRTEIQILTDALLDKHHDPLPEHSEWSEGPNDPVQKLKKQLADKEKALADEVEASQALQAKLKELRGLLNAERGRASGAVRALETERARCEQAAAAARVDLHTHQARLQRLLDDNHQLAQDKLLLQNADAEFQAQRVQMESHIKNLTESLAALQNEASAHAHDARQARIELAAVRDTLIMAQQHAAELAQQLQEANHAYGELEQHSQQERRQLQERLAELQNEVQRLANHTQVVEANTEKVKDESEKQKQQQLNEIKTLSEQLSAREAELAEIKQLKAVPAQNGLPIDENEQKISKAEFAKVESVVAALRNELESAQTCNKQQREQLDRLHDDLNQHKHKNDEAVAKAQEAQLAEVAAVLRAACPAAAPPAPPSPASTPDLAWLRTFAGNLTKHLENKLAQQNELLLQQTPGAAPHNDQRLNELTAQNEHLQSLVDKYKRIIDDTEGVLSRLQQNVTNEEQRWAQQLADKQKELDELRQRTVSQMQKKIDTLQEELTQAKSARHNHTFADAERLAEERLMGGLSDKHADISNGPLQLGLEDK